MKIITLLGLPASGKSYYGKRLAEELKVRFVPEIATQLIHKKGYKIGVNAPPEFDRDVFERNLERAEKVLRSRLKIIVWEGGPVLDYFFLEGRLKLGTARKEREDVLRLYDNRTFKELSERTTYILFNVEPQVSLQRQGERSKPELLTPDLKLLKIVHNRLINFYKKNRNKSILITVDKTKEEVFEEVKREISRITRQTQLCSRDKRLKRKIQKDYTT